MKTLTSILLLFSLSVSATSLDEVSRRCYSFIMTSSLTDHYKPESAAAMTKNIRKAHSVDDEIYYHCMMELSSYSGYGLIAAEDYVEAERYVP